MSEYTLVSYPVGIMIMEHDHEDIGLALAEMTLAHDLILKNARRDIMVMLKGNDAVIITPDECT